MTRDNATLVMVEEVPNEEEQTYLQKFEEAQASPPPTTMVSVTRQIPDNTTIIANPYESYLCNQAYGRLTDPVHVAAESNALRAIIPLVDGQDKVEAILDPGCQIIAMSEEVSNTLALPYDPTIWLNMVSANSGMDQSLGLAHNVPFLVRDITLYLQVHILYDPTYDTLLG